MTSLALVHRDTSGPLPTSTFDLVNDAGEVVGFAQIRHRPSASADLPPEAGNHVYYQVAEAHRGRGYGKALMGLTLAEA
jgi:predicted acetyltransferase